VIREVRERALQGVGEPMGITAVITWPFGREVVSIPVGRIAVVVKVPGSGGRVPGAAPIPGGQSQHGPASLLSTQAKH